MANSRVSYLGTGTLTDFSVPFPFLSKNHVLVRVNGTEQPYTWLNGTTVRFTAAPAAGAAVSIVRDSTQGGALVTFQDASNLVDRTLNVANLQALFTAEEARENADENTALAAAQAALQAANASLTQASASASAAAQALSAANQAASAAAAAASQVANKSSWLVGEYKEVSFAELEAGWLWANGDAVSRAIYHRLFDKIGTRYGAGDGSTTFNLPDRCGRAAFGADNMGGIAAKNRLTSAVSGVDGTTLGAAGGDQRAPQHTHGVNDPPHTHGVNDPGHAHTVLSRNTVTGGAAGGVGFWEGDSAAGTSLSGTGIFLASAATGVTIQSSGAGTAQNVPPALVVNVMIYTGVGLSEPDPDPDNQLLLENGEPLLLENGEPITF